MSSWNFGNQTVEQAVLEYFQGNISAKEFTHRYYSGKNFRTGLSYAYVLFKRYDPNQKNKSSYTVWSTKDGRHIHDVLHEEMKRGTTQDEFIDKYFTGSNREQAFTVLCKNANVPLVESNRKMHIAKYRIPMGNMANIESDRNREIVNEYLETGISMKSLANKHGLSRERIRQIIERNTIKYASTEERNVEVYNAYKTGMSVREISVKFQLSRSYVSDIVEGQKKAELSGT